MISKEAYARLAAEFPFKPTGKGGSTTVVMSLPQGRPCPACGEPHVCARRFGQRTLPARPSLRRRR